MVEYLAPNSIQETGSTSFLKLGYDSFFVNTFEGHSEPDRKNERQ